MSSTAIVIQARSGSTRLPNKMLLEYCNNSTMLDLIINRFKKYFNCDVWVATSVQKQDDEIEKTALKNHVLVYRGDEDNVLSRFCAIGETGKYDYLMRVCGDNPLISAHFAQKLIDSAEAVNKADYISYYYSTSTPAILTHYGFFSELIGTTTLLDLLRERQIQKEDKEHVTKYIYSHEDDYDILKLDMPDFIRENDWFRGTVDTNADFMNMKKFCKYADKELTESEIENLINDASKSLDLKEKMSDSIIKNRK